MWMKSGLLSLNGFDRTKEVTSSALIEASGLSLVSDVQSLISANVFIITVPTPVVRISVQISVT